MSLFSPLLAIAFDQDRAEGLAGLARLLGYPDAHVISGGFAEAVDVLARRASSPEYIIVDIGSRSQDIFPELDEFSLHCEPNVRAVVIGDVNDIEFYRKLKSRGILEYFQRSAEAADIRRILLMPSAAHTVPVVSAAPQGNVISLMSAASGDGSSTLAVNLAYCIAEEYRLPTVLVDMDYQFGLVSKSLDLIAPFGIRELFDHPDRGIDDLLVSKMLVKYKPNLSIVAAPTELRMLPMVRPEIVRELVSILRSQFAFVIIDVPHIWTDWTAAALTYSDHVVMVAQLWLRSLTHASRLLASWQNVGVAPDFVSLVINRSGAKFKEAVTIADFERICRHPIDAHIHNDVKAVSYAESHARTLLEDGQGGQIADQIRQLAHRLVTRYNPAATPAPPGGALSGKKHFLTKLGKT